MGIANWVKGISEEESKGAVARQNAIAEIQDTRGFQLILAQYERERAWASKKLEGDEDYETTLALRSYINAIDVLRNFLNSTKTNADLAKVRIINERPKQMSIDAYTDLVFNNQ